ncbi:MAG: Hpt domain-containing protein [Pseudomonadota bacterium]
MRLEDDIDFTTLSWVKRELDETLNQARLALQAFVEDPSDTSQMRFCATYLHQVQGTLAMVELHGAAMVVDELEQSATALLEEDVSDRDSAFDIMIRGMVQLPDYLERLQSGHRDIPIVLLPLLNEIRGIRGEKPVTEVALFAPRLDIDLPVSGPEKAVADVKMRAATVKLRKAFEASLLGWLRAGDNAEKADAMLGRMGAICDKLASITHAETPRRLWWIAAGIIEGVKVGAISPEREVKLAIGKVDQEMKRQALKGERAMVADSTDALSRQLLYFAASEPKVACERVTQLNELFGLSLLVPDESEVMHAQGSMTGHNRELLDTVASAIKEDLMRVKDGLDFKVRQGDMSSEGYTPLMEHLEKVADTLGMLGLEGPQGAVVDERDRLRRFSEGEAEASEESLMDVASAMLYVEAALDNYIDRLGSDEAEGEGEGLALSAELPSSEVRRILDALMKESSENLQEIKRSIIEFIEAPWDHERIKETPRLLQEIVGALEMLDLGEASELLYGVIRFINAELIAKRNVPSADQLDTLADAVASIEYFLEAVREHRPGKGKILEVAKSSLDRLGYLGEEGERKAAEAEAAAAEKAAEPEEAAEAPESELSEAETVIMPAVDMDAIEAATATEALPEESATEEAPVEAASAPAGASLEAAEEPAGADIDDDIDEEIREVFIEEVEEELVTLDELFPKWRAEPDDQETLGTIRRTFHTLKGSGRLVGAHTIGEFSWQIENLLNRILDGTREASPAVIALLGTAVDTLPQLLANVKGEGRPTADIEGIKHVAERLASGEEARLDAAAPAPAAEEVAVAETAPEPVEELVEEMASATDEEPGDEAVDFEEAVEIEEAAAAPVVAELDAAVEIPAVDEDTDAAEPSHELR